ncbi:MAG: C-GCAxxG-C-C family protein [Deltaproteobacteria bacterium]|uniref:C-GCAxxG-C-C family protein n=1 Tax=Candidatus Zymogenus saltonus TaxID=2844893 RepID=A0A9D8PMH8_9DELT|nr:C-GCAxxG-C-C family protein [Candidatus Zymogenus saltonus]
MKSSTRGRLYLVKNLNCALATVEALQDLTGTRDDLILKAVTGLEGGVVASGSTCGVLTAGAIFIAQFFDKEIAKGGPAAEALLLKKVGKYVDWFGGRFRTTLCSGRSRVDFYTAWGQIRYFVPGDRLFRCIRHIGESVRFVEENVKAGLDFADLSHEAKNNMSCAGEVLRRVDERTGIGIDMGPLERISIVHNGGVGLSGGVCGALAGSVIAVNSIFGMDVRSSNFPRNVRDFIVGHLNLILKRPVGMPEPFGLGREIVSEFKREAGSVNCSEIVRRKFRDLADFEAFYPKSDRCHKLIDFASEISCRTIEKWSHKGSI